MVGTLIASLTFSADALACEIRSDGPRWRARVSDRERDRFNGERRTAVVVCDRRTGRTIVLRRGVLRGSFEDGGRGRVFGDATAVGGRVAWIEARLGRRGRTVCVVVARASSHRVVRRRVVQRDGWRSSPHLEIVMSRRGELAWTVSTNRDGSTGKLVLHRPGMRDRVLDRSLPSGLRLEDDRTLSWFDDGGMLRFRELPDRPPWRGCPDRRRSEPALVETDLLRVTSASYDSFYGAYATVLRGCWRRTGRERILARFEGADDGSFTTHAVIGADDRWVALVIDDAFPRYDQGCYGARVRSIDVLGERRPREATGGGCAPALAAPGDQLAVTSAGWPAWVHDGRLLARGDEGKVVELDRGAITGLRADSNLVSWSNGGEARSARVGPPE